VGGSAGYEMHSRPLESLLTVIAVAVCFGKLSSDVDMMSLRGNDAMD
jgi:hypothetical protein